MHRGAVVRQMSVALDCCTSEQLPVYTCIEFGACVLRPAHDGRHDVSICQFCDQRKEPTDGDR